VEAPPVGSGAPQSPSRNNNLVHLSLKIQPLVANNFNDFPENGDGMALPGGEETTVVVERNARHWLWNAVPAEFNHTKLSTFKYFY